MARRRFKFFKPIYKNTGLQIPAEVVGATASILMLSVFTTLVAFQGTPATMNLKADPVVWKHIVAGGDVYATLVYKNTIDLRGIDILKEWDFGNLHIAYVHAQSDSLKKIIDNKNLIRISAWEKLKLPPYTYVIKEEGVTYDFSKDYKRLYHHANQKWQGDGVTVAVIDTGIDYLHPDFYRNGTTIIKALVSTIYKNANGTPIVVKTEGYTREQMENVLKYELSIKNATHGTSYVFEDAVGHGTHVAGIIAGQGTASDGRYMGIAPHAKLVIIKAFFDDHGGWASEETILDALQWIYDHAEEYNIKVLSCSWGSAPMSNLPDPIELAMKKLEDDKGIFIFCAAGNAGNIPSDIISPARAPWVFAVGAIDPYTNKIAPFSSLGEPLIPPFNPMNNTKPDFVGAGVNIIAPASSFAQFPDYAVIHGKGGNYVIMSGTSMATPAVASTFADFYEFWMATHGRPPTKEDFINYERKHGIIYDPFGKDFITGWGAPVVPPPK